MKCPGQDPAHWKPEDVFEAKCPACGAKVEFFKDDATRRCPSCEQLFRNPHIDLGCAEWCRYAEQCLSGTAPEILEMVRNRKAQREDKKK